jgi:hypothetical protein
MKRLSFRSVLFLLALVMQTATSGMAFARTHSSLPGVSADCNLANSGVHQTAPAHNGHRGQHDCLMCQMCAGVGAAALAVVTSEYLLAFDRGARQGLDLVLNSTPAASSERRQQPRAPPIS